MTNLDALKPQIALVHHLYERGVISVRSHQELFRAIRVLISHTHQAPSHCELINAQIICERIPKMIVSLIQGHKRLYSALIERLDCEYRENKINYISCLAPEYPKRLVSIPSPPLGLYVRGPIDLLTTRAKSIAIIGARKASTNALNTSESLAEQLSDKGYIIVSGGALGCDLAAHRGALKTKRGATFVLSAAGINHLFPNALKQFARQNEHLGNVVIISESHPDHKPRPYDFPRRNRLIAALADKVIVIQADIKSGAMITAELSEHLNKEILVDNRFGADIRYAGNQKLLDFGAKPLFPDLSHDEQIGKSS
jgi:DNA protecting protein DprA